MFLFKRILASSLLLFVIINNRAPQEGAAETAIIETARYKIFYNIEQAEYALNLASLIDKQFDNISRFIGYEPAGRLNIHLAEKSGTIRNITNSTSAESRYGLHVFADSEYSGNLDRIHEFTVQSLLSDIASQTTVFRKFRGPGLESWIPPAVSNYIIYGFDSRSSMFIRGLLKRDMRLSLENKAALTISGEERSALQIGFIHFINEYYGSRVLSFALKNIAYYGSLYNALENITGLSGEAITGDLNSFYYSRYKKGLEEKDSYLRDLFVTDIDGANLLASDMEGRILYAEKGKKGAVLYIWEPLTGKESRIKVAGISCNPDEVKKIDGAFIKGGGAAAAVTKKNGTLFLLFNMDPDKPDRSFFIPYVFSRELSRNQLPGNLVFSASEGSRTDIFTLNTESMEIKRISDSKGYYRSPALSDKGRLYCIEGKRFSRIVEYSESADTFKILAESKCVIDDLSINQYGDLIFSCDDEVSNLHFYSMRLDMVFPITGFTTGAFRPLVLNNNNVVFNYYTGKDYKAAVIDVDYKKLTLQSGNSDMTITGSE